MVTPIVQAPPDAADVALGRTLPSLLDEALERNPNPHAFQQRLPGGAWRALSTQALASRARRMAAGLLDLGLDKGDPVAFFTESDHSFVLADMACLLVGAPSVPLYLTHGDAAISHILRESGARALVTSNEELLARVLPQVREAGIGLLLVAEPGAEPAQAGATKLSFEELEARGARKLELEPDAVSRRTGALRAGDLATIIYTSGTTGLPKGVMLSHENISSNAIAAFRGLEGFQRGAEEVALSFLPLTHIFARTLHYGYLLYGTTVHFCGTTEVGERLREVRPTLFASVPRVLERAYERILARGGELSGVKEKLFDWALALATRHEVERPPTGLEAAQLALADRLVLSKWREALGGRVRFVIVGGAALRPELVNVFGAAKITVLQGYGLTETSPVIAYNRPGRNRPGTVGQALAGVEVRIAEDGEILTRGPHVMKGYFRQPDATAETIDGDGWLHTGDLGELSEDGYLRITGRKKNLFKLSTGKYVMPQPLEGRLEAEPLIEHAMILGDGEKYCGALLFLGDEALGDHARRRGAPVDPAAELVSDAVREHITGVLRQANAALPPWSQVKRAVLLRGDISPENGLLTPTLKLRREQVLERYAAAADRLYGRAVGGAEGVVVLEL